MYNYLYDNNILVGDQYGFRGTLSTETDLYTPTDAVDTDGTLPVLFFKFIMHAPLQ